MKQVLSNMAGTVIHVFVNIGDEVVEGQDVVMLESMKMEVPIAADISGKTSNIKVNIGDFVNEGDVLIELE